MAAFAVNTVVARAAEDDVVALGADQDIVSGPPYQGGNGAQSIDVLLFVHVLRDPAWYFKVVVQPVARRHFMLCEVGRGQRPAFGLGESRSNGERCRE